MKSPANTLLRRIAPLYDAYIGREQIAFDSHTWAGMAFDLAAAANYYHGVLVNDCRPSPIGGSKGMLDESMKSMGVGPSLRPLFRRAKGDTLAAACELAFRYYKAANGESHN